MKIGEIICDRNTISGDVTIDPEFWTDIEIDSLARADILKDISGIVDQLYTRAIEEWKEENPQRNKVSRL